MGLRVDGFLNSSTNRLKIYFGTFDCLDVSFFQEKNHLPVAARLLRHRGHRQRHDTTGIVHVFQQDGTVQSGLLPHAARSVARPVQDHDHSDHFLWVLYG